MFLLINLWPKSLVYFKPTWGVIFILHEMGTLVQTRFLLLKINMRKIDLWELWGICRWNKCIFPDKYLFYEKHLFHKNHIFLSHVEAVFRLSRNDFSDCFIAIRILKYWFYRMYSFSMLPLKTPVLLLPLCWDWLHHEMKPFFSHW